jgi:acylglycerol lipase
VSGNRRPWLHALTSAALTACSFALAACGGTPSPMPARTAGVAEPAVAGVRHTTGTFEGVRDLTLFEQSWRPDAPPRGVVVLVHGLKDHSARYAGFANELAQRGYAVYAFDLRGHGRSAGERVYIDSFEDYLGDLDVFMNRVRWKEPHRPLFLFGHSMGGAIVTLYTIKEKPALAGLVMTGPAFETDVSAIKIAGTKAIASLSPRAAVFQLDPEQFSHDPAVVRAARADPLIFQEAAPARTARELLGAMDTIGQRMAEVSVPLLILHGGADTVTLPQGSRDLDARAVSTDKTLKIYPGLYHDLLREPEHAQVQADIEHWLDQRAPAAR